MADTPIEELDAMRVHNMMEVNLFGTFYGSRAALRHMQKQGNGGTIVNILSTRSLDARAGQAGYTASKFAASGFTKALRLEATPYGIKVIAVYSGGMKTALFDKKRPADYGEFMEPADVARRIKENLERETPEEEMILKRPGK